MSRGQLSKLDCSGKAGIVAGCEGAGENVWGLGWVGSGSGKTGKAGITVRLLQM